MFTSFSIQSRCKKKFSLQREKKRNLCVTQQDAEAKKKKTYFIIT